MSRNFRHKTPVTPLQKKSKRGSRHTDDSSDDDYNGVDLISDSDGDEPDVQEAEENAIIESEEDSDDELQYTPRPVVEDAEWEGLGPINPDFTDETFFDEHMSRMHAPDAFTQAAAYNTTSSTYSEDEHATPRARPSTSDSDESENDGFDGFFPDIFLDQNNLDPGFRKIIENDDDEEKDMSDDGFRYSDGSDGDVAEHSITTKDTAVEDSESESDDDSLSGYETDYGDTTDEELPDAAKHILPRSVVRCPSPDSSEEEEVTREQRAPGGPRLASWIHDVSKKSFVVLDTNGKKLWMYKATKRRHSFGPQIPQMNTIQEEIREGFGSIPDLEPMTYDPGNVMISAMYSPFDQYIGPALGPPEAFVPFTSIAPDGTVTQDSSSFDEDDFDDFEDVDDENLWNVEDFLTFGDQSSDDEGQENAGPDLSSDTIEPFSTPARPSTEDQAHPLLNHFERNGVVGAFRRNQNRHQLLTRNAVSQDALAFSGPLSQGTLKGIKRGQLAAANVPITPMRRKKPFQQSIASSPGSPLANMTSANTKRKFSGNHFGHKRSRSEM